MTDSDGSSVPTIEVSGWSGASITLIIKAEALESDCKGDAAHAHTPWGGGVIIP